MNAKTTAAPLFVATLAGVSGTAARIVPGVEIELVTLVAAGRRYVKDALTGRMGPNEAFTIRKTFRVGDTAVVGSYNLTYTGTIRSITEKTVTVVEHEGSSMEKVYRMSLARFAGRNWDFDAEETAKRNAAWMD